MALSHIEIHVLGCGARGESIAVKLPSAEDRWGVIDSFTRSSSADEHPTLRFLKSRGVTELEFVALTHPHWDHYRGMAHLLTEFKVASFWRFDAISPIEVLIAVHGAPTQPDEDPTELEQIFTICRDNKIPRRTMAAATHLYPLPEWKNSVRFNIRSIASSGQDKDTYEERLHTCFQDGSLSRDRAAALDHNLISSALLIEFGNARVVLGGDVETNGWSVVLHEHNPGDLQSNVVKISHHGSTNGYCADLWNEFRGKGKCIAVLTPFTTSSLPEPAALQHISSFTQALYTTCVDAVSSEAQSSVLQAFEEVGSGLLFEEEAALSEIFSAVRPAREVFEGYQPGICSFVLNTDGIEDVTCVDGAGPLQESAANVAVTRRPIGQPADEKRD